MKCGYKQFIQFLHPEMNRKFRADDKYSCHAGILAKWNGSDYSDKLFTEDEFFSEIDKTQGKNDIYFSVNSFYCSHRKTNSVRHLNAIVLDYDFYKLDQFADLSAAEMYSQHIKNTLPADPSFVVDSGRGLYIIYALYHCPYQVTDLYRSIETTLQKSQACFGADPKATLITQVLRIPGTINSKSGRSVNVLEFNDIRYNISDLASLILPFTREQVDSWKKKKTDKKPCLNKIFNVQTKFEKDLERLIRLRNAAGIDSGYREQLIYLYWESLLWTNKKEDQIIAKVSHMNDLFASPLSADELLRQCRPAKKYAFRTSKKRIIEKLSISDSEMKEMKYLISEEKMRSSIMRKNRRKRGKTEKELSLKKRREDVIRYLGNKKIGEMADLFGVSKKTVLRDLKYVAEHLAEFQVILKEIFRQTLRTTADFIQAVIILSCDTTWSGMPEIFYRNGFFILL